MKMLSFLFYLFRNDLLPATDIYALGERGDVADVSAELATLQVVECMGSRRAGVFAADWLDAVVAAAAGSQLYLGLRSLVHA